MDPKSLLKSDPLSWWFPYVIAILVGVITCIREYVGGQECPNKNYCENEIILITGGSGVIAYEIATELAKRGGKILLACRDIVKGEQQKLKIKKIIPNADIVVLKLDISSVDSIKHFVKSELSSYKRIDILINNAAIKYNQFVLSNDGFELHLVTNYLGHFLLSHLLLPRLNTGNRGKIINITDDDHFQSPIFLNDLNITSNWNARNAYTQSKLCLVLMAKHMANLLKGTKITVNSVSPGKIQGVKTMRYYPFDMFLIQMWRYPFEWVFYKKPKQGAQSIIYAAIETKLNQFSGRLIKDCEVISFCKTAQGDKICEQLYLKSCGLLNIQPITKSI